MFIRKLRLRRKADWEVKDVQPEERAETHFQLLFGCDVAPYSVFLPKDEDQLHRVALALNAGRMGTKALVEQSEFLLFSLAELKNVGITVQQTPGATDCPYVNSLHYDLSGSKDQFCQLLVGIEIEGRALKEVTKPALKSMRDQALKENCHANPNVNVADICSFAQCPKDALPTGEMSEGSA